MKVLHLVWASLELYTEKNIQLNIIWHIVLIKATFSVHKLIPKNAQMTTLYTKWSLYITFTMIYYIRQE